MKMGTLHSRQSLGDMVMLTAAVRDLHYSRQGKFATDARTRGAYAPKYHLYYFLPNCLDLISAEEVIRRIGLYFDGGAVRQLTAKG